MKLDFIALDRLFVDRSNMRRGKKPPDVSDILPTVRKRGVLQPLIVRPAGEGGHFGIVAGSRRFRAAQIVAEERTAANDDGAGPEPEPGVGFLPCPILEEDDDAAAIEASLIENVARRDADEVTQWVTFTKLVKQGRDVDDIAATFGMPGLAVRRVLALGNLLPRIRDLYAREQIDRVTVRHLTMATKGQQQDWLGLVDDPDQRAPTGQALKAWLTGGQAIPARFALFDIEASGLATIADLFGEDRYFTDPQGFWEAQNAAVAERAGAYRARGWSEVVILPPGEWFHSWEYDRAARRKGGRVYIDVSASGEVVFHEGYVSRRDRRRAERGEAGGEGAPKAERGEVTAALDTYIDLHRHAAVRAALTGHPGAALRLMVAHAVAGSPLWIVRVDPQASRDAATRESVAGSLAETVFDRHRRAVLDLLGFGCEEPTVTGGCGDDFGPGDRLSAIFLRLLDLPDAAVLDVVAAVMGETLMAGSPAVAALGLVLGLDMADWWQADDALFGLIRDRQVLAAIVAEVAGPGVADANAREKGRTLKKIVADHLAGAGGRAKAGRWVSRWMAFPPATYTGRGGVGSVTAHTRVAAVLAARERPGPTGASDAAVPVEASGSAPPGEAQVAAAPRAA
ncbi:MAG TPA: ParB N-terminal domain-containing protein [Sphingomonas sp.]|nr:ParB N-terminal domain-containing protein [Sphingomonas sp.]